MDFICGMIQRALKVVIYGLEGVGKSTLASNFPNPLFIDTEDGTAHLDVRRIYGINSWQKLLDAIHEVILNPTLCETLVIDTADQAEAWAIQYILNEYSENGKPKKSIESFGYGKGYMILAEEFGKLLSALNDVIAAGVNVVVIAHAKAKKCTLPDEMGEFDHWELKLTKHVAPLVKEWADTLLFCNYKMFLVQDDSGKAKARGGERVMYTTHHPAFDAKNRQNLPDELPMEYSAIARIIPTIKQPRDQMFELMNRDGVTEEQLKAIVVERGHYGPEDPIDNYPDDFIRNWIIKHWDEIVELANAETAGQNKIIGRD